MKKFTTDKKIREAMTLVRTRLKLLPLDAYEKLDVKSEYLAKRAMEAGYAGDKLQMAALILLSLSINSNITGDGDDRAN